MPLALNFSHCYNLYLLSTYYALEVWVWLCSFILFENRMWNPKLLSSEFFQTKIDLSSSLCYTCAYVRMCIRISSMIHFPAWNMPSKMGFSTFTLVTSFKFQMHIQAYKCGNNAKMCYSDLIMDRMFASLQYHLYCMQQHCMRVNRCVSFTFDAFFSI